MRTLHGAFDFLRELFRAVPKAEADGVRIATVHASIAGAPHTA